MSSVFRLVAVASVIAVVVAIIVETRSGPDLVVETIRDQPEQRPAKSKTFCGPGACRDCHSDIYDAWTRSGHSKTISIAHENPVAPKLDSATYFDAERNLRFHYQFSDDGLVATLPDQFGDRAFPLQYALGSGQHAITFMSLVEDSDEGTIGIEHRASWFRHQGKLGATPQIPLPHPETEADHYGRKFVGEELQKCFDCHTTRVTIADAGLHDMIPQVSCESCHGAGSQHGDAAAEGDFVAMDFPSAALSEIAVCEKCHRSAKDAPADRLFADNVELVRFQPVGLTQSRCFTQSAGAMKCSTCHDPHDHYANTSQLEYQASCVQCHDSTQDAHVLCPQSPSGDCVKCHMPAVEVHPGVRFHDHWIRVRNDSVSETAEQ